MGNFIGGAGAAFILAAAAAVIVRFLTDAGLIKNADNALKYAKISLCTITIGAVYMFAATLMYNEFKDRANFFDFETIYQFAGGDAMIALCREISPDKLFSGMMMPLYPLAVHFFGKHIFEQYALTAQFISVASSCVCACTLYAVISKKISAAHTGDLLLLLAALPFAFMLFVPSYIALMASFMCAALYALSRGWNKAYILLAILALLTGKLGILTFAFYPMRSLAPQITAAAEKYLLKNEITFRIVTTVLIVISGAVICCMIRGI